MLLAARAWVTLLRFEETGVDKRGSAKLSWGWLKSWAMLMYDSAHVWQHEGQQQGSDLEAGMQRSHPSELCKQNK